MVFWKAKDVGAIPERSKDVWAGVSRRPKTSGMDAGSAVKTEERRGVGDHVW